MKVHGEGGTCRHGRGPRLMRISLSGLGLAGVAALLSGCSWIFGGPKSVDCPYATIEPELQTAALFAPGTDPAPANVQAGGKVTSVSASCLGDDKGISVKLTIDFEAARLTDKIQQASFPYLVALTDRERNILQEQNFDFSTDFSAGNKIAHEDSITVTIPTADIKSGHDYVVFVGFKLTPEQLAFNRSVGTP
jgi:hypothetical protein